MRVFFSVDKPFFIGKRPVYFGKGEVVKGYHVTPFGSIFSTFVVSVLIDDLNCVREFYLREVSRIDL